MFKSVFTATVILWSTIGYAQVYTIHGQVTRADNNQTLPGATLELKELNKHVVTDEFGVYRINRIPPGKYTLSARFLGYETGESEITVQADVTQDFSLTEVAQLTDEVVIYATRANDKVPTTFTNVSKQTVQKQNYGQDLPMLLNWTPSMVTTSDAGAGIGYTGMRIRGSDATRINVTVNGIAFNDSESQGVFWVNTPDLASSVQSIQIQRGVGTSTNGAGAFGASVNVMTDALNAKPYAEVAASAGSFGSQRYTFKAGTGLLNNRWAFDARISDIQSNGYIERATSNLHSYYISGGYYGDKTIVKAITFGGHEQTYQAWNGVDQETMMRDRRFNYSGAIYDEAGNITRYYDNEIDDYRQDHYQLHIAQQLGNNWSANIALHYTYGRGFFEQYQQGQSFQGLGLPDVTIGGETFTSTDAIVRRWLDNQYYGTTFSLNQETDNMTFTFGGAYSRYDRARHYGEIIWAQLATNSDIRQVYYDGESEKSDFNVYAKWTYNVTPKLGTYIDLQYRGVDYTGSGIEDQQVPYKIDDNFSFFNPKAGVTYALTGVSSLYASYAVAHREPNRTDYLDGDQKPEAERLGNLEAGWKKQGKGYALQFNYYLMNYHNQLVLTGKLNDVGSPIRANVGRSYRTGLELSGMGKLSKHVTLNANATWSVNKNQDYAYTNAAGNTTVGNTTIILSPSWIVGSQLTWSPLPEFDASLLTKYVGKQYLDNTGNDHVALDPYFINDIRLSYRITGKSLGQLEFGILVNNLFDVEYASNGYGYDGVPYFYPQAGINFLGMITLRL
jgi:iron complex outermembrane receptor protein